MSKEHITPQVGDVWEYKYGFDKIHIIETDLSNGYVRVLKKITGKYLQQREYTAEFFNDCRYLGKSKANIDDLFKTENEE